MVDRLTHADGARLEHVVFAHAGRDWIRGSEQCLLDLVARLDRRRFRPVVVCDAPTLAREAERLGATAVLVDRWDPGPVCPAPTRRRTEALLREHGAAIVHANMPEVLPAIIPAARALRLPVVAHIHIPMTPAERLHSLLHQADAVVGVAEHVVAALADEGMAPDRVRVIPNAVDEERLAAGEATGLRASLGIPDGACVAASIGSLIVRKGHDVSIRAVAAARTRGHDVRLLVCGDGEEAPALRALAVDVGAEGAVHFLGLRSDVGAVLRDAADVYVSAARQEALPLNVLEAQWAGLPAICSDIPAHHEAMRPGVTGVLVPGENPAAFADALTELAADPERRAEMGAAGRALVAERFTMTHYVGRFAALYDELLALPAAEYGWVHGTRWPRAYTAWAMAAARRRLLGR